jgi:hypothetical protein
MLKEKNITTTTQRINLMKKTMLFALLSLTSISSFAGDRIADIAAENPSASPYQVMQQFYDESSIPASITDFDLNTNTKSDQQCVAAEADSQTPYKLYIVRANFVVKPGLPAQPAYGPLFPGKPATPPQLGVTLLFNTRSRNVLDDQVDRLAKFNTIKTSATDMILTMVDTNYPETTIIMNTRENEGLLAIKVKINAGEPKEKTIFAYCFRQ